MPDMPVNVPSDFVQAPNAVVYEIQDTESLRSWVETLNLLKNDINRIEYTTGHAYDARMFSHEGMRELYALSVNKKELPNISKIEPSEPSSEGLSLPSFQVVYKADADGGVIFKTPNAPDDEKIEEVIPIPNIDIFLIGTVRRLIEEHALNNAEKGSWEQRWEVASSNIEKTLLMEERILKQDEWEKVKNTAETLIYNISVLTENEPNVKDTKRIEWLSQIQALAERNISIEFQPPQAEAQWQMDNLKALLKDKASDDLSMAVAMSKADAVCKQENEPTSYIREYTKDVASVEAAYREYIFANTREHPNEATIDEDYSEDLSILDSDDFEDIARDLHERVVKLLDTGDPTNPNGTGKEFERWWSIMGTTGSYAETRDELRAYVPQWADSLYTLYNRRQTVQDQWEALWEEAKGMRLELQGSKAHLNPHEQAMTEYLKIIEGITRTHMYEYAPSQVELEWRNSELKRQCSIAAVYLKQINEYQQKESLTEDEMRSKTEDELKHNAALEKVFKLKPNHSDMTNIEIEAKIGKCMQAISQAERVADLSDPKAKAELGQAWHYMALIVRPQREMLEENFYATYAGMGENNGANGQDKLDTENLRYIGSKLAQYASIETKAAFKADDYGVPHEITPPVYGHDFYSTYIARSGHIRVAFEYAMANIDRQLAEKGQLGNISTPEGKQELELRRNIESDARKEVINLGVTLGEVSHATNEVLTTLQVYYEKGLWDGKTPLKTMLVNNEISFETIETAINANRIGVDNIHRGVEEQEQGIGRT